MYTNYALHESFPIHAPVLNPSQASSQTLGSLSPQPVSQSSFHSLPFQSFQSPPPLLGPLPQALRFVFDFLLAVKKASIDLYSSPSTEPYTSSLPALMVNILNCLPAVRAYCQRYGGHAYFQLLLQHIDSYGIADPSFEYQSLDIVVDSLDEFMSALQHDLQTYQAISSHQKRIYNPHQLRSMQELIAYAFERYSKVLVLRVDLRYRDDIEVTYEQAKNDIQRFMDSRRFNTLFDDEIGSAYKLERGVNFHFHTLWLVNGHKHQKDAYLAQCIGERWSRMTEGRGIAYNCNYNKQNYQQCGIGMTHRSETEERTNLLNAAQYLCKEDPLIRAYVPAGHRTFFRSVVK